MAAALSHPALNGALSGAAMEALPAPALVSLSPGTPTWVASCPWRQLVRPLSACPSRAIPQAPPGPGAPTRAPALGPSRPIAVPPQGPRRGGCSPCSALGHSPLPCLCRGTPLPLHTQPPAMVQAGGSPSFPHPRGQASRKALRGAGRHPSGARGWGCCGCHATGVGTAEALRGQTPLCLHLVTARPSLSSGQGPRGRSRAQPHPLQVGGQPRRPRCSGAAVGPLPHHACGSL